MKKPVPAVIAAALLATSLSFGVYRINHRVLCSGFLPKNSMRIPVGDIHAAGISEAVFNRVMDNMQKVYGPIVAQHGGNLVINRLWDDPTVNASAEEQGGDFILNMYGGLARHPAITEAGMYLVACHEMGHHLGGFPKEGDWATDEGGADYFATLKCMRRMMPGTALPDGADPVATAACKAQFKSAADRNRCERGTMAGESVVALFQALAPAPQVPALNTPDPSQVDQTDDSHPAGQCRLDTYFQGALCTKSVDEAQSDTDPAPGACTRSAGYTVGNRPRCWYKPPANAAVMSLAADHKLPSVDGLRNSIEAMASTLSGRGV